MNIRVDLNYPINDGTEVVFRSPVDCSQVTGLKVYYPGTNGNTASQEFAFADAHGNNVGDIDHLFAENVVVKVILDVTTSMAFVQNADTNAYLEGRFAECVTHTEQALTEEQKAQARENIGATAPEVYVGAGDMPEGYVLQIDPDGEAPQPKYELLETIAYEVGVDSYVREGLALDAAMVKIKAPKATATATVITTFYSNNNVTIGQGDIAAAGTSSSLWSVWDLHKVFGYWNLVYFKQSSVWAGNILAQPRYYKSIAVEQQPQIAKISITQTSGLPADTTIEIWGVRANA